MKVTLLRNMTSSLTVSDVDRHSHLKLSISSLRKKEGK